MQNNAITPFKVIQGHRFWYQSKAHIRFLISDPSFRRNIPHIPFRILPSAFRMPQFRILPTAHKATINSAAA